MEVYFHTLELYNHLLIFHRCKSYFKEDLDPLSLNIALKTCLIFYLHIYCSILLTVIPFFLGGMVLVRSQCAILGYQKITFNGSIVTLNSTNITYNYTFITFYVLLIFYPRFKVLLLY